MKKTILYESHIALNAKMVDFAGFLMPISYHSISEEHSYVREKAGLFDVSHMGEFYIKGRETEKLVDYIFTNDVRTIADKKILYGMMCYPDGGIVDDLLVYKVNKEFFILVVNASNIAKDFKWITSHNQFECSITDESDTISEIALQGQLAEKILSALTDYSLENLKFFTFDNMSISGENVLVSRTGYTGEDGFEIYGNSHAIKSLWHKLLEVGQDDIMPCGLGARDTLRFEAALPLYGNELSDSVTPLEAGLNFAVKFENRNFIGKAALIQQKSDKIQRRIVGIKLLDKGIIRQGYKIYHDEKIIGEITTGYKIPNTDEVVALAMIDKPYDKLGTLLNVAVRGKMKKVMVVNKPFYRKNYKK